MIFRCKCKKPPFHFTDFDIEQLGENKFGEASLQTCKKCGSVWLKFLIEEPHYTKSGRWWRAELSKKDLSLLTLDTAKDCIESQDTCFVGGSFYEKGLHKIIKPICVK